jgi:hypothetical protein
VTVTARSPSGSVVSPQSQEVTGGQPFTITQSGVPAGAGFASATIQVDWHGDDHPATKTARATLTGSCSKTATATTFANGTCQNPQPTYTIPSVEGVDYEVNGETVAPGTHDAEPGDVITVTAEARPGYTLAGDTSWPPFTFAALPANCAAAPTSVQPSCSSPKGEYTIPATEGGTYFVDGKRTAAGTYGVEPGSTVKITALASDGHALPGPSSWTFTFGAGPANCGANLVPAFVDTTCTEGGDGHHDLDAHVPGPAAVRAFGGEQRRRAHAGPDRPGRTGGTGRPARGAAGADRGGTALRRTPQPRPTRHPVMRSAGGRAG